MRIQLLSLCIFIAFIASCSGNVGSAPDEKQVLGTLKGNQAKVSIQIGGKWFYSNESLFGGNIQVERDRFSLNISDQFEGQIMLGFYAPQWYKQFPMKYEVLEANRNDCRFMIGRIIDKQNRIGEGYLMSSGTIEITELTKDGLIMKINGKCGKYNGFELDRNLMDISGSIVFKQPNVLFLDMKWEDFQ